MKNKFILTGLLLLGLAVSLAPSAAAVPFVVDNFESYSGSIPNAYQTGWLETSWAPTFSSALETNPVNVGEGQQSMLLETYAASGGNGGYMAHRFVGTVDWSGQTDIRFWAKGDAGGDPGAVYRIWIGNVTGSNVYNNIAKSKVRLLSDLDSSGEYVTLTLDASDTSVWESGSTLNLTAVKRVWVSLYSYNGQGDGGNPSKLWVDDIQAIPEPGSLFLLGTGLLGLVSGLRRKMKG
ncbi:MAG: PEP-CTERM sorting domain-containing protein [Nitrospirae bacterium]|nr:PEP-CTERM sorting domain-containing protein [Nitrospirota bacterium]